METNWIEITALIISILTLVGSLWGYIHHGRRINEQEIRLKDLQIEKLEKEKCEERMADMRSEIRRTGKGKASIFFVNMGKTDALNVRIGILTDEKEMNSIIRLSKWGPYDKIDSKSSKEEVFILGSNYPDEVKIKISWDDTYQIGRSIEHSVSIPKS